MNSLYRLCRTQLGCSLLGLPVQSVSKVPDCGFGGRYHIDFLGMPFRASPSQLAVENFREIKGQILKTALSAVNARPGRHAACVTDPRLPSRQSAAAERSSVVRKHRGFLVSGRSGMFPASQDGVHRLAYRLCPRTPQDRQRGVGSAGQGVTRRGVLHDGPSGGAGGDSGGRSLVQRSIGRRSGAES